MKMRLKYRLKSALQFIAFAFYPKTTLIACTVFSVMVISILGIVMTLIPHDSNWYNLVFAFTVGATGSFFVSFVVELRKKLLAKYANPVMLIIDEWLLLKPTESEQQDILELLHRRRRKSSTIFCSQYNPSGWYDQLGGDYSPLAEAILDRIKRDAYKINIVPTYPSNYHSMREVYGLDPGVSE